MSLKNTLTRRLIRKKNNDSNNIEKNYNIDL